MDIPHSHPNNYHDKIFDPEQCLDQKTQQFYQQTCRNLISTSDNNTNPEKNCTAGLTLFCKSNILTQHHYDEHINLLVGVTNHCTHTKDKSQCLDMFLKNLK
jgi:hypothetical protein